MTRKSVLILVIVAVQIVFWVAAIVGSIAIGVLTLRLLGVIQ